jgi:hypothetical protein
MRPDYSLNKFGYQVTPPEPGWDEKACGFSVYSFYISRNNAATISAHLRTPANLNSRFFISMVSSNPQPRHPRIASHVGNCDYIILRLT